MISIIVAIGKNNLIGKDNDLPWYYPEDLKYFKEKTLEKKVLMGEKTFYSIFSRLNKPLPKRENIVATLDKNFMYPNVKVVNDLNSYLEEIKDTKEEVFIIGGKQIYQICLPYAKKLYITHINKDYEGNVFFPEIDYSNYEKIEERQSGDICFCVYERVK